MPTSAEQTRDRWVVVTGASSGIGRATVGRLARAGYGVVATVQTDADVPSLAEELGDGAAVIRLDVRDDQAVAEMGDRARQCVGQGGVWGLVNNAGVAVPGPIEALGAAEWRDQLEVNLVGAMGMVRALLPMLRQSRGRIVNVSSDSGYLATPLLGAYCASKFAMEGASDSLRRELQPHGVKVSLVEPGPIATPIWDKGFELADELLRQAGPSVAEVYGGQMERGRQFARQCVEEALPADRAAAVIERALSSRRPKARYAVGLDARMQWLTTRWLPSWVMDRLIARAMR
jgi:NAD(P)-dependent dehydrogenase (short-subunit alcohol dehydrogenase family)